MHDYEIITKEQGETLGLFYRDWSRCTFIMGPLGSGKTIQTCQKLFDAMCRQTPNDENIRPTRFLAVRNTYSDLTTTTIKDWLALYGDFGRFKQGGMEPPTHTLDFDIDDGTRVNAQLIFLALDRPESIKKLRGIQCTGFWLNEVKELPKAVVDMADLRHGRYPSNASGGTKPSWHGMIGDTNAPDDDHWYFKVAEEQRPDGWVFYRQPGGVVRDGDDWEINPKAENTHNLPDGYYLNGMKGKSNDWIAVNLANEYGYVQDGKPIYPMYTDSKHCSEPIEYQEGEKIYLGMDFGLTPACVFMHENLGQVLVFDEVVTEDADAREFAELVLKKLNGPYRSSKYIGWGDPAGDQRSALKKSETVFSILYDAGLKIDACHTQEPLIRHGSVNKMLSRLNYNGDPCLIISPTCKTLRKGLAGGYAYRRIQVVGAERYADKPNKSIYSHVCEGLEYGIVGMGFGDNLSADDRTSDKERGKTMKAKRQYGSGARNGRNRNY